MVPVTLRSRVTEVGTLELWCVERGGRRWKLEYNVRESDELDHESSASTSARPTRRWRTSIRRSRRASSPTRSRSWSGRARCCRGRRCRRSSISRASTSCRRRRWRCRGAGQPTVIVGELARTQGTNVPGRLVSSAKSWLCHPRVDRLAPILPWGESASRRRSASRRSRRRAAYLRHLAGVWRHAQRPRARRRGCRAVRAGLVRRGGARADGARGRARPGLGKVDAARGAAGGVLRVARRSPRRGSARRRRDGAGVRHRRRHHRLLAHHRCASARASTSAPPSAITCCSAATTWISRSPAASRRAWRSGEQARAPRLPAAGAGLPRRQGAPARRRGRARRGRSPSPAADRS